MSHLKIIKIGLILLTTLTAAFPVTTVQAEEIPDSAFVSGFYGYAQGHSLSCEARSTADLAGFWGVQVTEEQILSQLPASDNPNKGFVGNADDIWGNIPPRSYGVHADPLVKLMREYGLKAHSEMNLSIDDLKQEIAAGHPVIVWVIGQMWNGTADRIELKDQEQVEVAAYEHTMILTGYSPDVVQVFDPYYGVYEIFPLAAFERSWSVLGRMAITVNGYKDSSETDDQNSEEAQPQATPVTPDTYTVQKGDYLIALANEFGVDWRWLVEINHIPYPWTIYPGQQLRMH